MGGELGGPGLGHSVQGGSTAYKGVWGACPTVW